MLRNCSFECELKVSSIVNIYSRVGHIPNGIQSAFRARLKVRYVCIAEQSFTVS